MRGVVIQGHDITDQKRIQGALIQSEKLAAVGKLASSIAHEINNPLESVTNLLFLARSPQSGPEEKDEFLETAERELRRVTLITNQTLRFHKQSSRPASVMVPELVEGVLAIFQGRLLNSRIEVLRRERALGPIECFEGEIRQVMNNLVGNAIDAMPASGKLLLRSYEGTSWRSGAKGIVLTVADTGTGMPEAVRRKIFDPFFTTKGIGGTGLGLWVSKDIVDRHHGELKVRSSQQAGRSGTVLHHVSTLRRRQPIRHYFCRLEGRNYAGDFVSCIATPMQPTGTVLIYGHDPLLLQTRRRNLGAGWLPPGRLKSLMRLRASLPPMRLGCSSSARRFPIKKVRQPSRSLTRFVQK